jgi:acyl-CoA reductase-like NAD-dependent aldehyde dehydrogenase
LIQTETKLRTINPATEAILNEYDIMTKEQIEGKVKTSRNTFSEWKKDAGKRADFLYAFANEFRKNKENLAKTATQEMGKVIKESRSEVEKCAWVWNTLPITEKSLRQMKWSIPMQERVS